MLSYKAIEVALALMEGLNCARSLTVTLLIRGNEWDQLSKLECDPRDYDCSSAFWKANQATAFLRKNPYLPLGRDLEAEARELFFKNESACYRANKRLDPYLDNGIPHAGPSEWAVRDFIDTCRKEILSIIGSGPARDFPGFFGPGATQSDTSRACTVPDKMSSVPTLTRDAWPYLVPWMRTKWAACKGASWSEGLVVRGNSFFTVPKSATALRGCAKEPSFNSFYQLGLGRLLRQKLDVAGIHLREGQTIHGQVARRASKDGLFATIDLSSASDTICSNLVKLLLPERWFTALDCLRSRFTNVDGKTVMLEKFSSMGNGFTFELETLLFAVISKTASGGGAQLGRDVYVYGDDIIVHSAVSSDVISALKFFGFEVNQKKTFTDGEFRESCGSDFFRGDRVRPYYLKGDLDEPQHYISVANGLRRACEGPDFDRRWALVRRAWFCVLDGLPSHIRKLRGPRELGDLVIHDEEGRWITRWRSNCIRYISVYRPARYRKVRWEGFGYDVQFAAALYGVVLKADRWLIPRDGVIGYKVGWTPYS